MSKSSAKASDVGIRPEDELLLWCARTNMDSEGTGRIRDILRKDVDWEYLIQTASSHGVKPLLCWNLNTTCPEAVPKVILDQLRRYFQAHSLKNLFLTRELLRLLRLLDEHGISAIPYKGPVLAAAVYGNVALRRFGDLDILVRKQDAMRAKDLLLSEGYRGHYQQSSGHGAAFHDLRKVYELDREDGRVVVELHWAITSWTFYFPLDFGCLWEHLETVSMDGTPVRNLAPEDLLLILSVHGAKHHWGRLMWISDIAELLRVYQGIDWGQVTEKASSLGGARMLYLGLFLARDLLGATLPQDIWQRVQADPVVPSLAAQVQSRLFANGPLMAVERPTFYIKLRERARDRVRCGFYLVYRMMAPRAQEWALVLLRAWLSFRNSLCRTIRWNRQLGKGL